MSEIPMTMIICDEMEAGTQLKASQRKKNSEYEKRGIGESS